MHDTDTLRQSEPAGRRSATLAFAALAGVALLLAACGGGGGGALTPAAPTPDPQPAAEPDPEPDPEPAVELPFMLDRHIATVDDVYGVAFGPAIESAAVAAKTIPHFRGDDYGSVTISNGGPAGGYVARSSLTDDVLDVSLREYFGTRSEKLSFDTAGATQDSGWMKHAIQTIHRSGENRGYYGYRIFDSNDAGVTAGRVLLEAERATDGGLDSEDWTVIGYWWRLRGRDFMQAAERLPTLQAVEIGAFADGPEFTVAPANLPVTGSATYEGNSVGVYMAEYGTDYSGGGIIGRQMDGDRANERTVAGSTFAGEFKGHVSLRMDFATGDMRGTVGGDPNLQSPGNPVIAVSGVLKEPDETRVLSDVSLPLKIEFVGDIQDDGVRRGRVFSSRAVRMTDMIAASASSDRELLRRIVKSEGILSGRFSNILIDSAHPGYGPEGEGEPRFVIGTYGADSTTAGDTRHVFIGGFGLFHCEPGCLSAR